MDKETQQQIEQITGYKFSNRNLLTNAFTHSSAADDRFLSNERLEFFGDSILAVVICQILFERFPGYLEGDLTKIKSMLVSRDTCAEVAGQLGLQKFLKVGKGLASDRALSGSLAAGLLEAVIAAIYFDGGLDAARSFILRTFGPLIDQADAEQAQGNFKSLLQEYAQQRLNATPVYELLDEKGPDHDKCFESQVFVGDRHFLSAWGRSKKEAEQKAAFNALVELGLLESALPDHND
ncbi:MAG TPA: ribonuclease III [Sedimentisphaerales bacterium]|nr:ribonuclease III [Sedimentisphaerales bacterium]